MDQINYETPKPELREAWWRLPTALLLGGCGLTVSSYFAFIPWPELYDLATFTPTGPIRPMNFTFFCFLGLIASMVLAVPLGLACGSLTRKLPGQVVLILILFTAVMPIVNLIASSVIIAVRGIDLGD